MRPLLLVLVLSVACSDEPDIPKPAHRGVDAPDQEAWDVTKKVTRNGRLRASIRAPHLRKYDRERISRLDGGVSVTFYGQRSGEVLSRLTSKKAEIDEGRRVLTAMDSVILLSGRGSTLYTDTLRWEEETEMIRGPAEVRIESEDGTETGIGFEAKSDLSSWTLREVVTHILPHNTRVATPGDTLNATTGDTLR